MLKARCSNASWWTSWREEVKFTFFNKVQSPKSYWRHKGNYNINKSSLHFIPLQKDRGQYYKFRSISYLPSTVCIKLTINFKHTFWRNLGGDMERGNRNTLCCCKCTSKSKCCKTDQSVSNYILQCVLLTGNKFNHSRLFYKIIFSYYIAWLSQSCEACVSG